MRRKSGSLQRPPLYFLTQMKNIFFNKNKPNEPEWRRRDALSSCTRRHHRVRCLTTENVFHMNSKNTATPQPCYSVSLSSVFQPVQIIFMRIFYCCFSLYFAKPSAQLKDSNLNVKFDISGLRLMFGESKVLKASSLKVDRKHLDYYCCFCNSFEPSLCPLWSFNTGITDTISI